MNKIHSQKQKRFSIILTIVMVAIMFLTVYPVWFSLINSLNSADSIAKNGFALLWPGEFTMDSWVSVLKNKDIFRAFGITLSRTVIVTVLQTVITAMFAYGFSRNNLVGKKFYTVIGFISMYLSGGVIAYFILFNTLHIYNTYWVYILPCLFGGFYNVLIFNTNFKGIPESLFESTKIDGASEFVIFFKIVFPLSKPVISALGIFTAVATWNDYTQTLYYTKSPELQTLSYYMLSITKSSQSAAQLGETMSASASSVLTTLSNSASNYKTIELACMVLSAIPLIIMYPFAQKFFEKGVMVGSVKG
ncbi:MAG: carbohydrate ABC transporter permease [Ruminococcus flavefaciens]|nr:carbohydrate ABC transporter permease [Eubacterium sp.]MCM1235186.1 carbohydrate ABC transporter permease [Ruminococcus flavefaciens]